MPDPEIMPDDLRDCDDLALRIAREVARIARRAQRTTDGLEAAAIRAVGFDRIRILVDTYTIKPGVTIAEQIAIAQRAGVM